MDGWMDARSQRQLDPLRWVLVPAPDMRKMGIHFLPVVSRPAGSDRAGKVKSSRAPSMMRVSSEYFVDIAMYNTGDRLNTFW